MGARHTALFLNSFAAAMALVVVAFGFGWLFFTYPQVVFAWMAAGLFLLPFMLMLAAINPRDDD